MHHSSNYPRFDVLISLKIVFTLTNGADPDETLHLWHFICVFTVCHSTCLGVLSIQG